MSAVRTAVAQRGFDANTRLSPSAAQAFADHGYAFAIRYVPRITRHANDLTPEEVGVIRAVGLGLMVVQHVEDENAWVPTPAKGTQYGRVAASECIALGIAPRSTVWLDLEGVAVGTPASDVIAYCNNWYDAVAAAGFLPGLYVGWRCGLTPTQLYALKFAAYWSSYNLNADEFPATRGVMMRQRAARPEDIPLGIGFPIDVNLICGDAMGDVPAMDRS